jgi:MinD superfamily P-loop ATPase
VKLAIASGKGGTGKTTVATNLAFVAAAQGRDVAYLDCDVEEPNGAIFLRPVLRDDRPVYVPVPKVDEKACIHCGQCGAICRFSAIVAMNQLVLTFAELCHSCGGCKRVCPVGAISEQPRDIGRLQCGEANGIQFAQGLLNIGQVMSPPLIRAVKLAAPNAELTILDSPPGTSCPVIEAVRDAEYVLLVTEPTPFGLNDLRLAVDMVRTLGLPFGVVINRADSGDGKTVAYCREENIEVLAQIPDLRPVAEAYSRGQLASEVSPACREGFESLLEKCLRQEASA